MNIVNDSYWESNALYKKLFYDNYELMTSKDVNNKINIESDMQSLT